MCERLASSARAVRLRAQLRARSAHAVWPTEQDRIAATHLMGMEDLKWEKVEDGKYYMSRAQYDTCNEQL